jgi:hypothetical protein
VKGTPLEGANLYLGGTAATYKDMRDGSMYDLMIAVTAAIALIFLVMLGITAASNKPAEFRVHAKGALANGCTREQVQDVLLLVAMYCGVPAAIETNRIAAEIFAEMPGAAPGPAAKP